MASLSSRRAVRTTAAKVHCDNRGLARTTLRQAADDARRPSYSPSQTMAPPSYQVDSTCGPNMYCSIWSGSVSALQTSSTDALISASRKRRCQSWVPSIHCRCAGLHLICPLLTTRQSARHGWRHGHAPTASATRRSHLHTPAESVAVPPETGPAAFASGEGTANASRRRRTPMVRAGHRQPESLTHTVRHRPRDDDSKRGDVP
jgi:hypothetical protein